MIKKVIFTGQAPSKYELNDICNINEYELQIYIDTGRYNIEIVGESKTNNPDSSWTNNEIRPYLDSENIEYKIADTKSQLLEKV